ncbi:MAG TPA: HAMP domain-containing sensor histidine kinase [Candidatus Limnocylindria bacterium]
MHSARTDVAAPAAAPAASRSSVRQRATSPLRWLTRLNVRLVLALAGVALLAMLVSGVALWQILPGYFREQARLRAETGEQATALYVQQYVDANPTQAIAREVRDTQLIQVAAQFAADQIVQGTITITYGDGSLAARASPSDPARQALEAQGLRPDPEVQPRRVRALLDIPFSEVDQILNYVVSEPYTNRQTTLARVWDALVGGGIVALIVSLIVGCLGARALTSPLARLRAVSSRFAHGELDARAASSNVLEVDELGRQFNVMADRLGESLRLLQADRDRLREFVADVSHELRTPIAALRTFTELQREGHIDEEQRREFLDRSTEQINRLEWMSTNLLDLSRIDAGIFPMDVRWGDLRDPVRSVVEAHSEQAEQRGVSLSVEVPTSPIMLRFDRERIVQLLSNLVGNGLKFTPRGGEVRIGARDAGPDAIVEVADSGPGIREDELPHVFDRFFRGTNVGEARASGSGLGLSIARSIVEMHGGEITVTSAPGQGAVFRVRLPHEPHEPPPAAGRAEAQGQ